MNASAIERGTGNETGEGVTAAGEVAEAEVEKVRSGGAIGRRAAVGVIKEEQDVNLW